MNAGLSYGQVWRGARDRLKAAGIEGAARDAKLLARLAFGLDELALTLRENEMAPIAEQVRLADLVARRLVREPIARIMGHKGFYGLDFGLNGATLVPRPETELLVELGLPLIAGCGPKRVLDLGTGSGCVVVALLLNAPEAAAVAVDISEAALAQARANADLHGVAARIDFREGSWFKPIAEDERFDLVVSNPPYIPRREIAGLDVDVRAFDPRLALDGGEDGLEAYRIIAAAGGRYLNSGGVVAVEHGAGQADAVAELFGQAGFGEITRHRDLGGHERVVVVQHL